MTYVDRRLTGRPTGKSQVREIEGGGHGFVLVDLDLPIPRPDPVWLQEQLAQRGIECEYPGCPSPAVTYLQLPKVYTPFLCRAHELACTSNISSFRARARQVVMDAMLDELLLTSFNKPRRWENPPDVTAQMRLPLAPSSQPKAVIPTFNRPKLGQN